MQQRLLFFGFRKTIPNLILGFFVSLLYTSKSYSHDTCPKVDSPESVALKYQLFSAYQTGFDGYEAPCELKCMGNISCQNRCQSGKALDFLAKQMSEIKIKKNISNCPALTLVCVEQCESQGTSCTQVCDGTDQRGLASTKTF